MGLDSYLFKDEPFDSQFTLSYSLRGEFFSGNGDDGSFLGEIYNDLFLELTGETLYQDKKKDPEWVAEMSRRLSEKIPRLIEGKSDEDVIHHKYHKITAGEARALMELFQQASEKGCKYVAWY